MSDILTRQVITPKRQDVAQLEKRQQQQQPFEPVAISTQADTERQKQEAEQSKAKFETDNIKLATNEYIPKSEFEKLSIEDQEIIRARGISGYNDYIQKKLDTDYTKLSSGSIS